MIRALMPGDVYKRQEEECNGILTYDRRVNKLKEDGDECGSAEM